MMVNLQTTTLILKLLPRPNSRLTRPKTKSVFTPFRVIWTLRRALTGLGFAPLRRHTHRWREHAQFFAGASCPFPGP